MEAIEAPKTFANDLAVVKEYIKENLSTETIEYTDKQIEDARIDISLLVKKKLVTLKTIALIAGLDCDVYHRAIRSNNNNKNAVTKLNLYLVEEENNSELWLLIENVHKWFSPIPKRRAPVPMNNRRRRSRSVDSMNIVSSSFRKEIVDLKLELKNASSKVQELMKIDETRQYRAPIDSNPFRRRRSLSVDSVSYEQILKLNKEISDLKSLLQNANVQIQSLLKVKLENEARIKELEKDRRLLELQSRMNTKTTVKRADFIKKKYSDK